MINQTAETGTPHLRGGEGCDPSVVAVIAARLVWTAPVLRSRESAPGGGVVARSFDFTLMTAPVSYKIGS
jgi:hypothetical protein